MGKEGSKVASSLGSGLFKQATNAQAYLKAGMLGFPGSGKTLTAYLIAQGLINNLSGKGKKKTPLMFIDTETGSDFLVKLAEEASIPFFVAKTRAFTDLVKAVEEAEKEGAVLIIDSVTHFWQELLTAYLKSKGRTRMYFQDWGPVKETWRAFTDLYVNSRVHIIMCGRAGYEYDYGQDDSGAKVLEKTGVKMKVESDMGYEPSLLIEMERARRGQDESVAGSATKKRKIHGGLWDHVAHVLKDRTRMLAGQSFINPTYESFAPAINYLNIGGEHVGLDINRTSSEAFKVDPEEELRKKRKQREITLEEIQGEILSVYPSTSGSDKKGKMELMDKVFKTRSWTKIDALPIEELEAGLQTMRDLVKTSKSPMSAG